MLLSPPLPWHNLNYCYEQQDVYKYIRDLDFMALHRGGTSEGTSTASGVQRICFFITSIGCLWGFISHPSALSLSGQEGRKLYPLFQDQPFLHSYFIHLLNIFRKVSLSLHRTLGFLFNTC